MDSAEYCSTCSGIATCTPPGLQIAAASPQQWQTRLPATAHSPDAASPERDTVVNRTCDAPRGLQAFSWRTAKVTKFCRSWQLPSAAADSGVKLASPVTESAPQLPQPESKSTRTPGHKVWRQRPAPQFLAAAPPPRLSSPCRCAQRQLPGPCSVPSYPL